MKQTLILNLNLKKHRTDNMEQVTYYHKKICLCKECEGTGYIIKYSPHDYRKENPIKFKCSQCKGTGRVVVSGKRVLEVEPYEPTNTDKLPEL